MATALHSVRTRFFDKCGNPLCGGTVHTYQVGTTTAKPTYTDVNKTAVNTNPVILDSIGSAAIFLDGAYRVRVLDRNGVLVEDIAYVESWISATEKTKIYESINNHVSNTENPHNVTKTQIGLNNVDNTSDINKPVSAATAQAIIEATQNKANKSTSLSGYGITDAYTKSEADEKITALSSTTYAGHKGYATLADAQAAQTSLAANTVVEVTNDSDSMKNGVYLWDGTTLTKSNNDVLGQAKAYTNAFKTELKDNSQTYTHTVFESFSLNNLDPNAVLTGYEIYGDGTIKAEPDSVVSGLIDVSDANFISLSGLQDNTQMLRYYHFLNKVGEVIFCNEIGTLNEKILSVPVGAAWFRISLKQRNPNPLDISKAQIEYGSTKSSYTDFVRGNIIGLQYRKLKQVQFSLQFTANGKNLFDKSAVLNNYEVYGDGRILEQPNSITSAPINVGGLSKITISGLTQNPEIERYVVFKDNMDAILNVATIAKSATEATFDIQPTAKKMQFSVKQRSVSAVNLDAVQVESGAVVSSYEPFKQGVSAINGVDIAIPTVNTNTNNSRAFGAKYLFFGDSITQTSNVDANNFTDTDFRSNWTKFAKSMLQMSSYRNYAKSGASFIEYNGQETWQKISHQVNTAITNAENPDIIVLACGTNDGNINLGSYETAMSKDIGALDRTNTAESMRWALYQIRKNFPNATCFYSTQLQRADVETEDRKVANDLMVKLAKRYGFYVIDSMYESGIVRDFEIWQQNGRYLSDGVHPNVAGQQVQANYIVSQIIERMTY